MKEVETTVNTLLAHLETHAKYLLQKNHEFYPIAAVIDSKGQITSVATTMDTDFPESIKILEELQKVLKEKSKDEVIVAVGTAMISIMELEKKVTDAINIRLEHKENVAIQVLLPYKKGLLKYTYSEAIFENKSPEVFK